uniref:Uncharacterized protein n=1 Tax=Anopheles dirus TaxID=7168 RepID=A0A182N0F7_9DIPT
MLCYLESNCRGGRDDSSASDEGDRERDTVTFFLGGCPSTSNLQMSVLNTLNTGIVSSSALYGGTPATAGGFGGSGGSSGAANVPANSGAASVTTTSGSSSYPSLSSFSVPLPALPSSVSLHGAGSNSFAPMTREHSVGDSAQSLLGDECLVSSSSSIVADPRIGLPRGKKAPAKLPQVVPSAVGKAPMPPPRKTLSSQSLFALSDGADLVALESPTLPVPPAAAAESARAAFATAAAGPPFPRAPLPQHQQQHLQHQQLQQRYVDGKVAQQPAAGRRAGGGGGGGGAGGQRAAAAVAVGDAVAASAGTAQTLLHQLDDTGSTDSSLFDEDVKKRPRKLFSFGKRFAKSKKQQ